MLKDKRDTRPKKRLRDYAEGATNHGATPKPAEPDPELNDIQALLASDTTDGPRGRSSVSARPVTHADSRAVERAARKMQALARSEEPGATVEGEPGDRALASQDPLADSAITLVPADATRIMLALPPTPPKRKPRHWLAGAVTVIMVAGLIYTGLTLVTPLARGQSEGLAVGNSGPLGLSFSVDTANQAPKGQWVTVIGAQPSGADIGGGAAPGVNAPGTAGLPVAHHNSVSKYTAPAPTVVSSPPLSPWPPANQYTPVPGYGSFGMSDPNSYYWWAFGQCTWWAQYQRRDENLEHMGNAQYWAGGARARGYTVSNVPRVGATVVFQPGVQGAGGAGHVAHVIKLYPDGWFLISEMNFYFDGGGWGRVDYRFAHTAWGVQFIY
jgi:surface antigen